MEENKNTVKPLLPDMAYALLPSSGELIVIKRSEDGYQKTDFSTSDREKNEAIRDSQNEKLGVSKAESEAMLAGSLLGYAAKAADPRSYDENGDPIKKEKEVIR